MHRPPPIAIENALRSLLDADPSARVAAIDALTAPGLVPVPASIGVAADRIASPATVLDLADPADRVVTAKLWGQALRQGVARTQIQLREGSDQHGYLYLFDLRSAHGVMIAAFVDRLPPAAALPELRQAPAPPPRFARVTKDASAVYRAVDRSITKMLGWEPNELIGSRTLVFIHPEDRELGITNWMEMLEAPGPSRPIRLRHSHRDGSWVWIEVTNHNRLSDPEHGDVETEIVDISDEMAAHEALRAREQLLAQLTDSVPVGLFHADARGRVLFSNRRLHDITGVVGARTLEEQLASTLPEDQPALRDALRSGNSEVEVAIASHDGSVRHCILSVRALTTNDGTVTGLTGCLKDITAMVSWRHELETKAATDPLTGCLNREATLAGLQQLLDRPPTSRPGPRAGVAVIFVDLDGFKRVNDELGHAAGDEHLLAVAQRMRAAIRPGDLLGRFGGDEFVVVCPEVPGPVEALEIGRTLGRRAFPATSRQEGQEVAVGASIGVAWTNSRGIEGAYLIRGADSAMYQSKRDGRGEPALAARVECHYGQAG